MFAHMSRGGLVAVIGILISVTSIDPPIVTAQEVAVTAGALTAKGAWSRSVLYRQNDVVTSRGSSWRAKKANKGKVPGQTQPSTAAFWEVLASGFNPKGAWVSTKKYQPNDLVTGSGSTWRAKLTNINKAPVTGPNWEQFAARGAAGPNTGVPGGSSLAPGISFAGDPETGIFSPAAGKIALVEDGALFLHNIGVENTVLGISALRFNTTGDNNTAVGASALRGNTTGRNNTAVGVSALLLNSDGENNIAVGKLAGFFPTSSDNSIFIGNQGMSGDSDTIKIGTQGTQQTTFIAGIHGAPSVGGIGVFVNSSGQLGTTTSSRRYKDDIAAMGGAGPMLMRLRPVTFRYKQAAEDGSKPLQYGLIAEEVAEISRDLVAYNKDGSVETVRYHFLAPLLLAGWQAQQKTIDAQADEIARLKERVAAHDALDARLRHLEARLAPVKEAALRE